jgi:D-threo-aldose 1-dehydrogenase
VDPFDRKKLGSTNVLLPRLGFGAAGLGNIVGVIPEPVAAATVAAAWDAGVRYFDTSPWYGLGLSERRVGTALYDKPRSEVILSTKVGRVLSAPANVAEHERNRRAWPYGLKFQYRYDYSYDGIMRSYEDSLQRLGMTRIDLLIIHDLDRASFATENLMRAHLTQLATGGMRALSELKAAGQIRAIGAGVNRLGTIPLFLDTVELDFFLVAMPYTLAEQPVLDSEFPRCEAAGVGVIIGAPFASGILATGVAPGARLNYRDPSAEDADKINRMEAVCRSFGVPLAAAALQFPLHHPLVASVIPGALSPAHPGLNVETLQHPIPPEMWSKLKHEGLLREDAPTLGAGG